MTDIHSTAVIAKEAELDAGVKVGPYCVIGSGVKVGAGTELMAHVVLDGHTTIGRDCRLFPFACIGMQTQDLKYRGETTYVAIGDRTTLREYVTVNSGTKEGEVTRVGSGCHIMAYAHVAHGCTVGNEVIMANSVALAGEVQVDDQAIIGGLTGVHQFTRIGRLCIIGGLSKVNKDCPPFMMCDGNPLGVHGLNSIGLERRGVTAESRRQLKEAYRILYRSGLSTAQAIERMRTELTSGPEVDALIAFVEQSERGIIK